MDYSELTEQIRLFTCEHVKKSRYEHSQRVADMCAELCRHYGLDDKKGYLVGIGHDMCKDFTPEQYSNLFSKYKIKISNSEKENPCLLHGKAAAVMMKEKFGITDLEILEAVENHTTGVLGMCDLAKCLFLADKIEPGRPQSTEEYRKNLMKMSLSEMFYSVLEENYLYILNKGYKIYPETKQMLEYYKKEIEG